MVAKKKSAKKNPPGRPKKKHPGGRPTKMTPEVIDKLEYAYSLDCTDAEACLHADISPDCLYKYQRENPEFIKRKEALKQTPFLVARKTIIKDLKEDSALALKYMERKKKDEFNTSKDLNIRDKTDDKTDDELDARIQELISKNTENLND